MSLGIDQLVDHTMRLDLKFQNLQSELKNSIMAPRGGRAKLEVISETCEHTRDLGETDRISGGCARWWMLGYVYGHHHKPPSWW